MQEPLAVEESLVRGSRSGRRVWMWIGVSGSHGSAYARATEFRRRMVFETATDPKSEPSA
jgi:hypothetical protein